jgi:uncharacterized protein (TIGR03000 family)
MRKIFFAAALCVAALLTLPSLSLAQHHGGGGGGGGHNSGGAHNSGGYYGHNNGYYGHNGYYPSYGYGVIGYGGLYGGYVGNGWGIAVGVPVGGYYNYGYRPYYGGGYGYSSPYYGGSYSYSQSNTYVQPSAPTTSAYTPQSTLPPPTDNANANAVNMEVRVPENATLYIQGQKSDTTGTARRFVSAALEPGRNYVYELRATWMDANGKLVDRSKKVDVQAGAWVGVDMTQQ